MFFFLFTGVPLASWIQQILLKGAIHYQSSWIISLENGLKQLQFNKIKKVSRFFNYIGTFEHLQNLKFNYSRPSNIVPWVILYKVYASVKLFQFLFFRIWFYSKYFFVILNFFGLNFNKILYFNLSFVDLYFRIILNFFHSFF